MEPSKVLRFFIDHSHGGMDTYVRAFGLNMHHDEFYSNEMIIDAFKNYTTNIVSRNVNSSGWELANDPRFVVLLAYVM